MIGNAARDIKTVMVMTKRREYACRMHLQSGFFPSEERCCKCDEGWRPVHDCHVTGQQERLPAHPRDGLIAALERKDGDVVPLAQVEPAQRLSCKR
jgi:hypothetical protein